MSDTEDIFADNSTDGTTYLSSSSRQEPQESILIEETESELEEEEEDEEEKAIRDRMKKRQSRRMSFHPRQTSSDVSSSSESESEDHEVGEVSIASDGDTSEEERANESRALSPATRLSISGVRPPDFSEDDDDEIIAVRKVKRNILISDDEEEVVEKNGDSFDDSLPLRSFNAEESATNGSTSPQLSSTALSQDAREDSITKGRPSRDVRMSIETKLSSTVLEPKAEEGTRSDSGTSDLAILEKSDEILSLSSDDEKPVKIKPLLQPTIKSALAKQQVSQKFYDGKVRELADLQKKHEKLGNLSKLSTSLPDKGAGLKTAAVNLEKDISKLKSEIGNMEVQHDLRGIREEIQKSFESSLEASSKIVLDSANSSIASNNASMQSAGDHKQSTNNNKVINISWDDIQKEADKIQPKHTGKQGIATFETQKTLTMDRLATLHKSIEACPSEDTLADPPKLLRIELMDHQKHALAWMLWRENQKPRGGILADDMGLGKTLSMISLILKKAELEDPDKEEEDSSDDEEEENNGWTVKGRRDYYAGGTLIVCPASLMRQWEGEIKNRVARNSLAVNVYHGTNRDMKPRHLAKYDVLITTYNIASREAKSERSGIFGVNWERIILDEAHMIRNHKSAMSEACCRLKGRFRWVLTGTPIQNKEMDMYALMKFLRCTPFDDLTHWKKWIDNKTAGGMARLQTIMKSLMLRRTKKQLQEKGSLNCLPDKNVELVEVTLEKDEMNVYQKVLLYSRTLFGQFLHQRAEKEHDGYMGYQRNVPTFAQKQLPNMAFDRVHQKLKQMHSNQEVKQFQILVLLLRLRQICCHPGLIHQMLEDDDGNFDLSTVEEENSQELDLLAQLNKLKLTDASDEGAGDGVIAELDISGNTSQDSAAITKASSKVMLRSNPVFDLTRVSSKIARLLKLLDEKIIDSDDKAVIVSQWSSVLDIVAQHLSAKRVRYVSLTGKVPVKFRNDIVSDFNKPGAGPKVMLLSLTAGGVGLNLVGANHLLLLDLHWNPQLEAQAQDRVYRVGQKKTVYVWKFMCVETVEQAIKGLQDKKLEIANEVLTGTKHKGSKLSIDDLKTLFGL